MDSVEGVKTLAIEIYPCQVSKILKKDTPQPEDRFDFIMMAKWCEDFNKKGIECCIAYNDNEYVVLREYDCNDEFFKTKGNCKKQKGQITYKHDGKDSREYTNLQDLSTELYIKLRRFKIFQEYKV